MRRLFLRVRLQMLFILALLPVLATIRPAYAADERCFTETGQCLSGRFREYWEQNGGLAVFGFPIRAPQNEANRDTGQTYLTQWFERNRFELHPENQAPYDVLLGRLGDDLLRQQNRVWQSEPREAGPKADCIWFEATGHNVCNQAESRGFRSYWQAHGLLDRALDNYQRSLALFGLPLTEPKIETNSSGDTVLTQWFERARFEWHPDKPEPYTVLLGLLGNEAHSVLPDSLLVSSTAIGTPVGAGSYLFWLDVRSGTPVFYGYNAAEHTSFVVSQEVISEQTSFASDGRTVVWTEGIRRGGGINIMRRDLATGETGIAVWGLFGDWSGITVALNGDTLFYTDNEQEHRGLFAHDLNTDKEVLVSATGFAPLARDGKLLWTERTTTGSGAGQRTVIEAHLRLLGSDDERVIGKQEGVVGPTGYSGYDTLGDNVVWSLDGPNGDTHVFRYQISSGLTTALSTGTGSNPKLSGATVVWATHPYFDGTTGGKWTLVRYNLNDGSITNLTDPLPAQLDRPVAIVGSAVATMIDSGTSTGTALLRSLYLIGP